MLNVQWQYVTRRDQIKYKKVHRNEGEMEQPSNDFYSHWKRMDKCQNKTFNFLWWLQCAWNISKYFEEIFDLYDAWHSPITLSIVVHGSPYYINSPTIEWTHLSVICGNACHLCVLSLWNRQQYLGFWVSLFDLTIVGKNNNGHFCRSVSSAKVVKIVFYEYHHSKYWLPLLNKT